MKYLLYTCRYREMTERKKFSAFRIGHHCRLVQELFGLLQHLDLSYFAKIVVHHQVIKFCLIYYSTNVFWSFILDVWSCIFEPLRKLREDAKLVKIFPEFVTGEVDTFLCSVEFEIVDKSL